MKKTLTTLSIALATLAFANNVVVTVPAPVSTNHHNLSIGPDVFWQHFQEGKKKAETESNGGFGGVRLRYEYQTPNAFYLGTDGMFAAGRVKDEITVAGISTEKHRNALAANVEQRIGYTLGVSGPRSTIIPFAGIGWYYTKPFADDRYSNDFVYATAGFKSHNQVNNSFGLDLVAKGLYSFYDRTHVAGVTNSTWDDTAWGFEIDVPMTWQLNSTNTWALTFEPYIQDLDVSNHFMNVGGRLLACYQF